MKLAFSKETKHKCVYVAVENNPPPATDSIYVNKTWPPLAGARKALGHWPAEIELDAKVLP